MNSIEQRLADLRGEFGALARALRDAADALEGEGRLPSAELMAQIGGAEQALGEMLGRISCTDGALMTLVELEGAVGRYLAKNRALQVVRKCRRIVPEVEDARFVELLGAVLAYADGVEASILEGAVLASDLGVLDAVVELVEGREELSLELERAFELKQVVAERFGERTAFALATRGVLRGAESVEDVVKALVEDVVEVDEVQEAVGFEEGGDELTQVSPPVLNGQKEKVRSGSGGVKRRRVTADDILRKRAAKGAAKRETIGEFLAKNQQEDTSCLSEVTKGRPGTVALRKAEVLAKQMMAAKGIQLDENDSSALPVEAVKEVLGASEPLASPAVDAPKLMRARAAVVERVKAVETHEISEVLEEESEIEGALEAANQVWHLLDCGEDALAYHLSRGLEGESADPLRVSWRVIRAAILGSRITRSHGAMIGLIYEDAEHYDSSRYFSKTDQELNDGLRLLLAAGVLIPTVIGSESSASNILGDLKFNDSLGCVYDFCQELLGLRRRLPMRIDTEHINITRDSALWQAEREVLAQKVREFLEQAPLRTVKLQRATDVWKHWLEEGQPIGALTGWLLNAADVGAREIEQVERMLEELEERGALERLVHASDRHFHTTKIQGKAIDQLLRFSAEPVSLGRQWIALHRRNPLSEQSDYVQQHIHDLRELLNERLEQAHQAIELFGQEHAGNLYVRVGAQFFKRALTNLEALFDPNYEACDERELDPLLLLNTALLRLPEIMLDEDYEPLHGQSEISGKVLEGMAQGFAGYEQAFHRQLERADHVSSGQILEVFRAGRLVDEEKVEGFEGLRAKKIRFQLIELRDRMEKTRQHLDRSVAFGLVIERDRSRYAASLEAIEQRLEQEEKSGGNARIFEYLTILKAIDQELDASLKGQVEAARQRLHGLGALDETVRGRVEKILAGGDPVTASEYIKMLERGEQLPAESEKNAFDVFFDAEQFLLLEEGLQAMGGRLPLALRERRECPGLDLSGVSEAQLQSASAMLSAWFSAKNQPGKNIASSVEKVLAGLGFSVEKVGDPKHRPNQVSLYSVKVQALRDRNLCPLAGYGSNVAGNYTIVCVWKSPGEDELLSIVDKHDYTRGVIVFYFGRMSREQRRALAALSQKERRSFLVLDATLLYWLCGERSTRLSAFFQCTVPFTYTAPFDATASHVPPEMFYGRKWELERLEDPHGTCFIYGGRQLGKTALLRHVVRERHAPAEGRVFLWIDLKASGLGHRLSIDRIGHVIAEALKAHNVMPKSMASNMLEETIYDHIAGWLEKDNQRRILLLLDEADQFLELDGNENFPHCTRLKNLMERTHRRFKVVFAGLHNVQRTTRRENHPLAHFGEPICIGPLYEKGEWKEALELIEKPFETMGFRFASRDLPFRILSQTNFYPSLLQIYGKELLGYLHQHHGQIFDLNQSPPYVITSQHLQQAYQSQSLRDHIRQKFKFTLQLDQRYEVIVYAIAHEVRHNRPELLIDGLSVNRIRELALTWWEEGFSGIDSGYEIRVLLDEMVGLGVLMQVEAGHYTLRNLNIVLLLGTNEEIDEELLRERKLQAEYEPASFRSSFGEEGCGEFRRSPLTQAQESQVLGSKHGVLAVFGTEASGFRDLERRLALLCGDRLVAMRVSGGLSGFEKGLEDALRSRKGDGTWVFHVSGDVGWDRAWLGAAVKITQRQQSHRSIVRVVFSGDAARVWELCGQTGDEEELLVELGLEQVVTMEPWREAAVQMWLRDVKESLMLDNLEQLGVLTSGWPAYLYVFHAQARVSGRRDWQEVVKQYQEAMFGPENVSERLAKFGIPAEVRPLLTSIVEKDGRFGMNELLRDGHTVAQGQRLVRWGRWLRLIQLNSGGTSRQDLGFRLDPLLKELLEFSMLHE